LGSLLELIQEAKAFSSLKLHFKVHCSIAQLIAALVLAKVLVVTLRDQQPKRLFTIKATTSSAKPIKPN